MLVQNGNHIQLFECWEKQIELSSKAQPQNLTWSSEVQSFPLQMISAFLIQALSFACHDNVNDWKNCPFKVYFLWLRVKEAIIDLHRKSEKSSSRSSRSPSMEHIKKGGYMDMYQQILNMWSVGTFFCRLKGVSHEN